MTTRSRRFGLLVSTGSFLLAGISPALNMEGSREEGWALIQERQAAILSNLTSFTFYLTPHATTDKPCS